MNWFQRFMHRWLGWHYVGYIYDFGSRVDACRVKRYPNGQFYFKWCGSKRLFDPFNMHPKTVPLTWTPSEIVADPERPDPAQPDRPRNSASRYLQ